LRPVNPRIEIGPPRETADHSAFTHSAHAMVLQRIGPPPKQDDGST
jgi:hypothetical protein